MTNDDDYVNYDEPRLCYRCGIDCGGHGVAKSSNPPGYALELAVKALEEYDRGKKQGISDLEKAYLKKT